MSHKDKPRNEKEIKKEEVGDQQKNFPPDADDPNRKDEHKKE